MVEERKRNRGESHVDDGCGEVSNRVPKTSQTDDRASFGLLSDYFLACSRAYFLSLYSFFSVIIL